MNWKKGLLAISAIITCTTVTAYAKPVEMDLFYQGKNHHYKAEEVKINIDGTELVPKDMPAIIVEERVMLPMRQIAQALGCDVTWNDETKQVYITNQNEVVVFGIHEKTGYQNGTAFTMDVPPQIINERTMLPIRAVANALHLEIKWDHPTRTVSIQKQHTPTNPEPQTTNAITLRTITTPTSADGEQVFTIEADGAMTNVADASANDGQILLQFANTKSNITNSITQTNSNLVSAIQTTTQQTNGQFDTQMVLQLTQKANYTITQSPDKTKLMLSFTDTQSKDDTERSVIKDVSVLHDGDTDKITLSATGNFDAKVYTLSNPHRIVVDIPNVTSNLPETINTEGLQYVLSARTNMFTADTFRFVLETNDFIDYQYKEENQALVLTIKQKAVQNMHLEDANHVIYLDKVQPFAVNAVKLQDHYLEGYFDVVLPDNLEAVYANGTYEIGGDVIQRMEISTVNGNTVLRFVQNRISVYEVQDKGNQYAIVIKNPKEVYQKVLLLDAGHGGKDPGTSGNGQIEKNLTLAVAQKVAKQLQNSDIKVYLTRDSDVYPENAVRASTANQIADAMVSIHMNSGPPTANGTEVLYQVHANDDASKLTSKKLAEILQSSIVQATGNTNRGIKLWQDVLILNRTTVPTALIEVVFVTNAGDALKISTEAYQQQMATAIANGIETAMRTHTLR